MLARISTPGRATQLFPDSPNCRDFPMPRWQPGQTDLHALPFDFAPA